jgi:NCS1 family nucleobase:cation symporter-1
VRSLEKNGQRSNRLFQTTAMALPMCPWALLSGATVFISVMGGYATFLAPICGLMVSDYLLVRRGNVKLSSLVSRLKYDRHMLTLQYVCDPSSVYFYWKGVNWRAPVAWACGVAPLFPGFLATVSTVTIPLGLQRVYYLCFPRMHRLIQFGTKLINSRVYPLRNDLLLPLQAIPT